MNLSFACSLRIGEILGLTWNNVHISEQEIKDDDAWLYITQELARVKRSALAALNNKNIYRIFPAWTGKTTNTVLVLKKPKTDSSIRRVWIPKTVAYVLQELRKNQLHQIEMAGFDYTDYNLVIAFPNGHPCEEKRINQAFTKLKAEAKLPDVVFHSLRHSSATYKLKLNHGDLKATQGDTGHAEIDMLTKVYAHILDSDRKITAQRFEEAFYQSQDLPEQKDNSPSSPDIAALIAQIQQYPELGKIHSILFATLADSNRKLQLARIEKSATCFTHMTLSGAPTAARTRGLSLRRTRVVLFVHLISFDFLSFHLDLSRNSASFPKRQTGLIVGFVWLFRTPLLAEFQLFPIPRKPAIPSLPQGKEMQSRKERLALLCPAAFFCT